MTTFREEFEGILDAMQDTMSDLEDNMSNFRDSNSEALVRVVRSERDREAGESHHSERDYSIQRQLGTIRSG
eukprot:9725308-Karenia_brevis.AAC.1